MRDRMEKRAVGKMQPPMGLGLRKLRQAAAQGAVKTAVLFGKFLLHERLEIGAGFGQAEREETKEVAPAFGGSRDQLENRAKERLENLLDRDRRVARLLSNRSSRAMRASFNGFIRRFSIATMSASLVAK